MGKEQPRNSKGQWETVSSSPTKIISSPMSPTLAENHINATKIKSLEEVQALLLARLGRIPHIGLDLDGTMADTTAGLRKSVMEARDYPSSESVDKTLLPQPNIYSGYYEGDRAWFGDKKEFLQHFLAAEKEGLYLDLPIYEGAKQTIDQLKAAGFNITAVTARNSAYDKDTLLWVNKHSIPVEGVIHSGDDKHLISDIDFFIDDAPHVLQSLIDNGQKVIIYDQEYNQGIPGPRITEWSAEAILAAIEQIIEE
jgi:hypothetical protein